VSRLDIDAEEPWDRVVEAMRIRSRFFGRPAGATR
jgi:hypothetical protein